jgi:3-hydroxyacyl-CoA dehydrogenase
MALFMPPSAWRGENVPVVNYGLHGEIAVLTITSPPVNALSLAVRAGLLQGLQRAAQDPAVTALVVSGSGGMFSGGADISEIASGAALTAPMIADVQAQIEASGKPIVAAITGIALGGGFENQHLAAP